ncbi:MAG TPA: 3-ketoacyl-ACP reductase [Phycisphaerae bacterium]|nr:3-ketoacyl-ACP reductase [Phycisphaerae bacterium]HNU45076.1 3-ketoacyl-ACP reductase [Phycisphaerae bacterium]
MSSRAVAFVTGAGRGIGRGIALALARDRFNIVGNDLAYEANDQTTGLAEVEDRVRELGADFAPAPGDIARLEEHEGLLQTALRRFGRVDVLVNNAGVAPLSRCDVLETTPESFDRVLAVNARGAFFLTQRFARHMIGQARGPVAPAIVFISSVSAEVSSPMRAEYCISKAALSQAATVFADRLAEGGINVYEVRPGIIATDMTVPVKAQYDARIAGGLVPQQRWGQPEDVGRAVAALARGDFGYATGLVIELSGGMNIRHL